MSSKGTEPVSILKISIAFESRKPELSIFVTMASDTRDDEHTGEQPPRRRSRSHAPHHIDLSLAQSQASANGGFQVHTPKRTVWESVFVTDLPVKEATKLTHESYRKAQSAMAVLCKIRVQNNESHSRNGEDQQRLQTIYHTMNSTRRTHGCCGSKRHRETSWVSGYILALTRKRRKNSGTQLISRKGTGENTLMTSHIISLRLRTWPWKLHRVQASRGSQISGEDAVLTDPAIVLIKFK
jgi:hypothetical protein